MKRRLLMLALVTACMQPISSRAAQLDGSVFLMPIESTTFKSVGRVTYLNDLNQPDSMPISGSHTVTGPQTFIHPVQADREYSHHFEGPAEPGACYGTTLQASADPPGPFNEINKTWTGETRCAPTQQSDAGTGDQSTGTCTNCTGSGGSGGWTPIVINRKSTDFPLCGLRQGVPFDINGTGVRRLTSWTDRESALEFLWLDRNGDGAVSSAAELFNFDSIRELDTSGDGLLDRNDSTWSKLQLWRDANHDGLSRTEEIESLASTSIEAFELQFRVIGRRDGHGNLLRYQSFVIERGNGRRPYYDVLFMHQ